MTEKRDAYRKELIENLQRGVSITALTSLLKDVAKEDAHNMQDKYKESIQSILRDHFGKRWSCPVMQALADAQAEALYYRWLATEDLQKTTSDDTL